MTRTHHYNGLKTAVLLGGMWSLLLLIGYVLARGTGSAIWLIIAPVIGLVQTAYGFWNSDKIAVRSMGAIEVTEAQQPQMYAIVRELSAAAGQPMPRLYVAPTMSPTAFATGRSPSHAAVCCTQGILQLLNERELRGVLGHELSHVYNRDILTSSVAAGIAGVISSLATMALWFGGGNRRDRDGGNIVAVLLLSWPLYRLRALPPGRPDRPGTHEGPTRSSPGWGPREPGLRRPRRSARSASP